MFHACFNGESLQIIPFEHLHMTKLKIHPGWRLQPKPQCQMMKRPKNHGLCKPYMSQKMHLNQMFKSLWMFQESTSLAFCFFFTIFVPTIFYAYAQKKSWTNPNKTKTNGWSWQPNPLKKPPVLRKPGKLVEHTRPRTSSSLLKKKQTANPPQTNHESIYPIGSMGLV